MNEISDIYAGASAFSEPESKAHRDDMATLTDVKAYLTYHSFSEFLIYPYSSSHSKEAVNKDELELVAQNMVSAIRAVHGHNYGHGEGAPAFGVASGGSDDWAHDSGIPLRNVFACVLEFIFGPPLI